MSSGITLTAGVRQNLLSLQNTAALMATTQNRLATGKKVNSALDNPTSFFTSQSLSNRASDLNSLLDSIGQAEQTLQAANTGITSLTTLVQSAKSIATQAQQATKGTVNYTNITGTAAIALDSTKSSSSASTVATAGTASVQATAHVNAAGIGKLANGDTLTFQLGSGTTITATFGAATNAATNTFHDAAGLISVLNTGGGANFGTTATAASDGAGGVTLTSSDVTKDFTVGHTVADVTFTNANDVATAHSLGDALTISDGSHTSTFYRVAAGASAANGTYSSAATLASSINNAANNIHTNITGTATAPASTSPPPTTSASRSAAPSARRSASAPRAGPQQLQHDVERPERQRDGAGRLEHRPHPHVRHRQRPDQHQGRTRYGAAGVHRHHRLDRSTGHINFAPTSSDNVTIGGTPSVLTALGVGGGTTTPTATVVTPNATRTNLQTQYNALLTQIDQLAKRCVLQRHQPALRRQPEGHVQRERHRAR